VKRLLKDDPRRMVSKPHSPERGHSYDIFDNDYQFKGLEVCGHWRSRLLVQDRLLDAMDFTPVSFTLSYNKENPLPSKVFAGLL
jgi:hypothetical protein